MPEMVMRRFLDEKYFIFVLLSSDNKVYII